MISIIVPCFNEEESLPVFYREITKVCSTLKEDYEVLIIDDGSRDQTRKIARSLAKEDPHIVPICFSRNFGKESAMYAGFCHAKGDYVAVMDADLQDPPALLPQMLDILKSGEYDSVATRREDRKGEPVLRSWFARRFYQIMNKVSDAEIIDGARDFRMMKRDMVDAILSMKEYDRFSKGIFGWVGFRTCWLPYQNVERVAGTTKWNFWKLTVYAIDGIMNFSQLPILAVLFSGIVMMGISVAGLILELILKMIAGCAVSSSVLLVLVLLFLAGIQMTALGILGRYIAKIYLETKHRPHFILAGEEEKQK